MNKKLLAMGLSVTMIAGMLTGCEALQQNLVILQHQLLRHNQKLQNRILHLKYHRQQLLMTNQLL